jgi:putative endonuclease
MRIHLYYVYILTNVSHSVLYTGVTNDLRRRCSEHKQKKIKGFSQKYNVDKLVYFEQFDLVESAIAREKQIKGYSKSKKVILINSLNTTRTDLYNHSKIEIPNNKM